MARAAGEGPIKKRMPYVLIVGADGSTELTINPDGRADVVQHAHPDSGATHFHIEGLDSTPGTYRFILIDMSDTTNYPHESTNYVHLEWVEAQVDSDNQGDYTVSVGFLENVDASNGDRYIVKHWSGTKTAGNQLSVFDDMYPNGWRMRSENIATHAISLDDANYQTDVNLPSTLSPSVSDTPSGNGDIILEVVVNAGVINVSVDIGYHSH